MRLAALTDLENLDIPLSDGRSDRLNAVIDGLVKTKPVQIATVYLTELFDTLPPVWQKIMSLLEKQGTQVKNYMETSTEETGTNLSTVQAALSKGQARGALSEKDDSLNILEAGNEWEAAEQLALWLASQQVDNEGVTIICGMDTAVLDKALRRHGLPSLGRSELSKWREIQQILPLWLANVWKPIDVRLMVELLSLSVSPVPKEARYDLLKAIAKEPGIGGGAWNEAFTKIKAKKQQVLAAEGDAKADEKAQKSINELRLLLEEERFDPFTGIPEEKLNERCQKMIAWAAKRVINEPRMAEIINQARDIQMISKGKAFISQIALARMLDSVIGVGSASGDISEEAAPWRVVNHPGQLTGKYREIVWWGFNETAAEMPTYWSKQERAALSQAGLTIEESKNFRNREAQAWRKGLLLAEKCFIGITIGQVDGEQSYHHPFLDAIVSAALEAGQPVTEEALRSCIVSKTKNLNTGSQWKFAGRTNTLVRAKKTVAVAAKPIYKVPEAAVKRPEELSYTQMKTLFGCPMEWALKYHAGLRLPNSQTIPTGNQMIGTLCHRIVEELYSGNGYIDAASAKKSAEVLYDRLLPAMASELLIEGKALERQRYKVMIGEAVKKLVETIDRLGLTVEKTEVPLKATVNGTLFTGFADMLLKDREGKPFVFDLKWTGTSKYHKQEIEEGRALQLALYAWMIKSAEPAPKVDVGYFMLAQGEILSDRSLHSNEATASKYTLDEVWQRGLVALEDNCRKIDSGLIEASGIKERMKVEEGKKTVEKLREELNEGMFYQESSCCFCDFQRLCGLTRGE